MAHVHVVIIGLTLSTDAPADRRLFSYPDLKGGAEESRYAAISPYLFDAGGLANPHIVVRETAQALNGWPPLLSGSQPIDDGNYIFNERQRITFLEKEPAAEKFLRPYVGSREHIQRRQRWILALQEAEPSDLATMPSVVKRMRAVRAFRSKSKRRSTLAIADYPRSYNVEVMPTEPFLVLPKVSSERREYVPIGSLEPPTVPSDLVFVLQGATKPLFALLTSAMHMAWLRQIGGRLKSDYRYSIGLVYNTFPPPPAEAEALEKLTPLTDAVLEARAKHPDASLAELYDPDLMPSDLRRAHHAIDHAASRRKAPAWSTCSPPTNASQTPSPRKLPSNQDVGEENGDHSGSSRAVRAPTYECSGGSATGTAFRRLFRSARRCFQMNCPTR